MRKIWGITTVMMLSAILSIVVSCNFEKRDPNEWFVLNVASTADSSNFVASKIVGYQRVKITGTINQKDFRKLRTVVTLYHLDLSEATVVGDVIVAYRTPTTPDISQRGNALPAGAFGQMSVLIPGVDTINYTAHKNLRTIIFPKNLASIGKNAFWGCALNKQLDIPSSLLRIYDSAFNGCGYLKGELKLPEDIMYLGAFAFAQCANLTGTLEIPIDLDSVAESTFANCPNFTEIKLHDQIKIIGDFAFAAATISSINLPEFLEEIGYGSFRNCRNLKGTLNLPKNLRKLGRSAFDSTGFETIKLNWTAANQMPAWDTSKRWFPDRFETSKYTHQYTITVPKGTLELYQRLFAFEGKIYYNLVEDK